jgi:hypothetical protein
MDTRQILLLRVGMDLGFGGLGPLFPGGTFEYVPIPDDPESVSGQSLSFHDIPARNSDGSIVRFVPQKYIGGPAHYDPEFNTFTYGDPSRNKRGQLLRLCSNDLLVFYAGLRPVEQCRGSKLYIIGYFVVQHVHEMISITPWPPPALRHLWGNAHFRRNDPDTDLVIVEGNPTTSRLLKYAVPLSDGQQDILPEVANILGISGSVKRAGAGRWIPASHIEKVKQWLYVF